MTKDIRSGRKQSVKLQEGFYAQTLHKSMFFKDLSVAVPAWYVKAWGGDFLNARRKGEKWTGVCLNYRPPGAAADEEIHFQVDLSIMNAADRTLQSGFRIKWGKDLAIQLGQDYPQSFVRSLEFYLGDEEYKDRGYAEYDIGGFTEQLQIKIKWLQDGVPQVLIRELFRVNDMAQLFPHVYRELGPYLIAEHLIGSKKQKDRRTPSTGWKPREEMRKELKENILYVLANSESEEFYVGETNQSLAMRYPPGTQHHTWDEWKEYCVIHLPEDVSNEMRRIIERAMIETLSQLFPSALSGSKPLFGEQGVKLKNKAR